AKREDRWRVTGAVRLEGLPMDHRILRVPGKPDILIRRTASAGVPSPTGIDAVRFTRHEVHVSLLADDMRTFDACFPSSFDLKDLAVRDVNSDNIQDVILTVGDFSAAMSSTNAVRSVE